MGFFIVEFQPCYLLPVKSCTTSLTSISQSPSNGNDSKIYLLGLLRGLNNVLS